MRFCPFCGADSPVAVEMAQLVENGPPVFVEKCQKGHLLPKEPIIIEQTIAPGVNVSVTLDKAKATKRTSLTPGDLLRAARARVKELNVEIAHLAKLTKERDELARLIEASKPKATVHAIKRTS